MVRDDPQLIVNRVDLSGGINNRIHGSKINEDQATALINVDIGVPGETKKRPGETLIENLGSTIGVGAYGFEPIGGTDELLVQHGTKLEGWTTTGTFTEYKTDFTSTDSMKILKAIDTTDGEIVILSNTIDNVFSMNQSHTFTDLGSGNLNPPKTLAYLWYRNRLWALKDNKLYWSDAIPSSFSTAWNQTTNAYNMPVGKEKALISIRDLGIICFGSDSVWGINPSVSPVSSDKPEKIVDIGCAAGNTVVQVGDDIMFLSYDGVRKLFRSQQDKVQMGSSFPVSYLLKDEFDSLNWAKIEKATAVYFDNKYFIAVPVDASSYNNEVWVYYPASNGWTVITGWNVGAWAKLKVSGEERLYYIDSNNASVYQAWTGYDDNGTAINYQEEGRKEDMGLPLRTKTGGEVKIRALSSGDYDLSVYASKDNQEYQLLGTINLKGNAPTLPATLPFTLADDNIVEEVFHLDTLGAWRQLRLKIQHNALNGSDDIKIYERGIITYGDNYQSA